MNKEELLELVANGENSGVEFKRDNIRPEQLAKEIVALANLKGGHILLGVEDDGTITGICRKNLEEWVADTVFARYVHPIILPYYEEILLDGGKKVAVVTIGHEISKPYVLRAKDRETAYMRIGSVSRPATREQLLMLGAASGFVHTEIMPVNRTDYTFLDHARLNNYLKDIIQDPDLPHDEQGWIARLTALGFMTEGVGGHPVCTIAGLVLFGIRPRQTLKQSGIRLMFFNAENKQYNALMDTVLDAPLVGRFQVGKGDKNLIDAGLIEKTLDAMRPFVTLEPDAIDEHFRREKIWLYPYEALRELIVNALAHRDWSRFVDVEIAGYSDRLEIISPGALPNSMTIPKMLAGQRSARNQVIVEVLRDYGYVDARGMGVRTKVLPSLRGVGKVPEFEATEDYMKVVVGKVSEKMSENEPKLSDKKPDSYPEVPDTPKNDVGKVSEKILALLTDTPNLNIARLAEELSVSSRTVERNLKKLQEQGMLERVGGKKTGSWKVLVK